MKVYRYFLIKAKLDHGEVRNAIEKLDVEYVNVTQKEWDAVVEEED